MDCPLEYGEDSLTLTLPSPLITIESFTNESASQQDTCNAEKVKIKSATNKIFIIFIKMT